MKLKNDEDGEYEIGSNAMRTCGEQQEKLVRVQSRKVEKRRRMRYLQ